MLRELEVITEAEVQRNTFTYHYVQRRLGHHARENPLCKARRWFDYRRMAWVFDLEVPFVLPIRGASNPHPTDPRCTHPDCGGFFWCDRCPQ